MLFPQPYSPAVLVETAHSIKDLLVSTKMKNRSNQPIVGYRIGWVAVCLTAREKLGLSLPVDLPLGVNPERQ
jgi:hypothetical protein